MGIISQRDPGLTGSTELHSRGNLSAWCRRPQGLRVKTLSETYCTERALLMASGLVCREGKAWRHKDKTWVEQEIAFKQSAEAETNWCSGSLKQRADGLIPSWSFLDSSQNDLQSSIKVKCGTFTGDSTNILTAMDISWHRQCPTRQL